VEPILSELADLLEACRAAPLSQGVVRAMLRVAHEAVDCTEALGWLARVDPAAYPAETRSLAADLLLAQGRPAEALAWSWGDAPEMGLRRAKAKAAEGDAGAALQAYHVAVEAQPDLRDDAFASSLSSAPAPAEPVVVDLKGRPVTMPPAEEGHGRDSVTFAEVGGLDELKAEIRRKIILPFTQQGLFQKFKKRSGGGILLYGPPGCGKTLLARATAGEARGHFIAVSVPEILSKWFGESEQRLAALFQTARAHRPAVLFFDEIEALAGRRDHAGASPMSAVVSTFLTLMDGATQDNEGVLVLGATNVPWAVDPAFRRQGRFDRVLFVAPPDKAARLAILKVMTDGRPGAERLDLAVIAQRAPAFSAADLGQVVDIACDLAIEASLERNAIVNLTTELMLEAVARTRPTTLEWLTEARNYAKFANEGGLYDDVVRFLQKSGR
jgi:transitional endoplasmic reticulum ATPase